MSYNIYREVRLWGARNGSSLLLFSLYGPPGILLFLSKCHIIYLELKKSHKSYGRKVPISTLFFIFLKKAKKNEPTLLSMLNIIHMMMWSTCIYKHEAKAPWYFKDGARGRNRTDTPITGPRILSPVRLPVSPLEH